MHRDWSRPVINWFKTGLVITKDCKRPVYIGPVQSLAAFGNVRTSYGYGLRHPRPKDWTGPDFQTLFLFLLCCR